jgi:cyclophilin family peptidyl-prolyl cis-trans isomerase
LLTSPLACAYPLLQVVLRTTLGDLDIELWPKEAPKAVRNFVQVGCREEV